jgi:hypothetical protein
MTDERLQIWLNFWKLLIVSGVLGLVGTIAPHLINSQIQQKELAIKENEQKNEFDNGQGQI